MTTGEKFGEELDHLAAPRLAAARAHHRLLLCGSDPADRGLRQLRQQLVLDRAQSRQRFAPARHQRALVDRHVDRRTVGRHRLFSRFDPRAGRDSCDRPSVVDAARGCDCHRNRCRHRGRCRQRRADRVFPAPAVHRHPRHDGCDPRRHLHLFADAAVLDEQVLQRRDWRRAASSATIPYTFLVFLRLPADHLRIS